MLNNELLKEIGLTKWESQTYLALLEMGSTTTGPLVKKSGVPQSKIYVVLDSLISKGLVSYMIRGQTKYFQASNPQRILDLFKEKERQVISVLEEIKQKQKQEKHAVELFEGLKAMRIMFKGMIEDAKKNENWYGFSTGETSKNPKIEEFYEWWGAQKELARLKDHLLISLKNKESFEKSVDPNALQYIKKIMRYGKISFPGDVAIFRNQVVILDWGEIPTATLITNENLANQYKNFFLEIWRSARK